MRVEDLANCVWPPALSLDVSGHELAREALYRVCPFNLAPGAFNNLLLLSSVTDGA